MAIICSLNHDLASSVDIHSLGRRLAIQLHTVYGVPGVSLSQAP